MSLKAMKVVPVGIQTMTGVSLEILLRRMWYNPSKYFCFVEIIHDIKFLPNYRCIILDLSWIWLHLNCMKFGSQIFTYLRQVTKLKTLKIIYFKSLYDITFSRMEWG